MVNKSNQTGGVVALPDDKTAAEGESLRKFLQRIQPEIARALPRGMDADRIARIALTLVRQSEMQAQKENRTTSLARCTHESVAGALLTASALGLEPGINGEAYLVPYKTECTLIVGYQGLVKLFWQHPLAKYLDAQAVYERDQFDYELGRSQFIMHRPARGDRGEIVAYWAAAELTSGAFQFQVLTPDEVQALRGGRVGPSGSIADPQRWMERKTVLRQLLKLMPKSVTLSTALVVDEQRGSTLARHGAPAAIAAGDPVAALPPAIVQEQSIPTVTVPDPAEPDTAPAAVPSSSTEPKPEPEQTGITAAQLKKLHTLFTKLKITDTKHADLSVLLRREITSTKDLSQSEADTVIAKLDDLSREDDPITAYDFLLDTLREDAGYGF